jgi:hypothetical protein
MADVEIDPSLTELGSTGRMFYWYEWERLRLDSEESCRARFRSLLENNPFLNGTFRLY